MTQPLELIDRHRHQYVGAMRLQHEQAAALLAQDPPDYSGAATACHRALQFERQAQTLEQLHRELTEQLEPAADEWPPGSCEQCGHRWADHHPQDGCGACALTFTRSCKGWPL